MRFGMEDVEPEGPGDWRLTHDPSGWFTGVILVDRPVEMNVFTKRHHFNATSPESGTRRSSPRSDATRRE